MSASFRFCSKYIIRIKWIARKITYGIVYSVLSQNVIRILRNGYRLSLFRSLILEKHRATHTFRYDCIYASSILRSRFLDRVFGTFYAPHTGPMMTLDSLFSNNTRIDHLGHHVDRIIDRCNGWFTRPSTYKFPALYTRKGYIFPDKEIKRVLNEDMRRNQNLT